LDGAVEAEALDDERDVNRALVRAALVLGVARSEVAAVIAEEEEDGVVFEAALGECLANLAYGVVDALYCAAIVGKLFLPVAGKVFEIAGEEGIGVFAVVLFWTYEAVAVVLLMNLQLGDNEQEGSAHTAEKLLCALRDEVGAVDAGERDYLPCAVVDLAFVGM
jgi:hypothetical protein